MTPSNMSEGIFFLSTQKLVSETNALVDHPMSFAPASTQTGQDLKKSARRHGREP